MASLPNSPATKAKGKTPLRGGIVAKNKTLLAAGPEEGEAKSSRAAKESARLIERTPLLWGVGREILTKLSFTIFINSVT